MTCPAHPLDFVLNFLARHPRVTDVFLSTYRSHPESLIDDRETYRIDANKLQLKYDTLVNGLLRNEEIAFHSFVRTIGSPKAEKHIPLVDFQSRNPRAVEAAAEMLIREYQIKRAALFVSGRSFHLYLGALFLPKEWVKFMGRLLLLNPRRGPLLTDPRWIGHRLMGGYGALRWSANTSPYSKVGPPKLVRSW
jgi:hypothetical protein